MRYDGFGPFARWGRRKGKQQRHSSLVAAESEHDGDQAEKSNERRSVSHGRVLRTRKAPSPQYEMAIFLDNLEELPVPVVETELNTSGTERVFEAILSYCTTHSSSRSALNEGSIPNENGFQTVGTPAIVEENQNEMIAIVADSIRDNGSNVSHCGVDVVTSEGSMEGNGGNKGTIPPKTQHREILQTIPDGAKHTHAVEVGKEGCMTSSTNDRRRDKARRENRRAKKRKKLRKEKWRQNQVTQQMLKEDESSNCMCQQVKQHV